jgi:hypothetical protein
MGLFPTFPFNERFQRAGRALVALALLLTVLPESIRAQGDFSLRFYGTGRDGVDRVMIPLDAPPRPVDVGGDFTIEFWLKALPGDMRHQPASPAKITGSTVTSSSTAMSTLLATTRLRYLARRWAHCVWHQ